MSHQKQITRQVQLEQGRKKKNFKKKKVSSPECGVGEMLSPQGSAQLSSAQIHEIAQHMGINSLDSHCHKEAFRLLKSIYLLSLLPNLMQKPVFTPLASLAFLPVATSHSLTLSPSLHLPSFFKFPNKSQQIDTYLSPPPSLPFCPFSCSCSTWGAVINRISAFPFPHLSPDAVCILLL